MRFTYESVRRHYDETKPIRGRSVDVRPAGTRRRDWEQVRYVGDNKYAYRLYQTDCVIYSPEGITLQHDKWMTPSTAKFMTEWSPFGVIKNKNMLWASVPNYGWLPIYKQLFIKTSGGGYEVDVQPVPVKVIDKPVAKELRKRLDPFIKYCTVMLKLSDGWVTHDFFEKVTEGKYLRKVMLEDLINPTEETLPYCFARMTHEMRSTESRRVTSTSYYTYDKRYTPEAYKKAILRFHDTNEPRVYKTEYRQPTGDTFANIVRPD